jgi:hypothetical protein
MHVAIGPVRKYAARQGRQMRNIKSPMYDEVLSAFKKILGYRSNHRRPLDLDPLVTPFIAALPLSNTLINPSAEPIHY